MLSVQVELAGPGTFCFQEADDICPCELDLDSPLMPLRTVIFGKCLFRGKPKKGACVNAARLDLLNSFKENLRHCFKMARNQHRKGEKKKVLKM